MKTLIRAFLFVVLAGSYGVSATEGQAAGEQAKPDVRVIIDISGSMKQNDPQNLRRPAMELLVQLFPEQSKAGVWTFGRWVNMLVKHQQVDQQWREQALPEAQKINSVALHTNIPEAIAKAVTDLEELDPAYRTSLILLTDGMVDISKDPAVNRGARQRVLEEILPRLKQAGVTVHTVALSRNADTELMDSLALETGGLSAVAVTADDLTEIFLQAFDAAAPAEQLPLAGNTFLVDSSVEEFTALVFRKAGSPPALLVSPDDSQYSAESKNQDVRWFSKQNYDLITVKRPYEGEWKIVADLEPNSRVTVVSDLSLSVSRLPINQYLGQQPQLQAKLMEQGKPLARSELLDMVDLRLRVTRQLDGKQWDQVLGADQPVPEDGVYTAALTMLEQAGIYQVEVIADGKTFTRQQTQRIKVHEAFASSVSSRANEKQIEYSVSLQSQNPGLYVSKTQVMAVITRPDGGSAMKPAELGADATWTVTEVGGNHSGDYSVVFEVEGRYQDGELFSAGGFQSSSAGPAATAGGKTRT